jgi:hypothetical protein
MIQKYLLTFSGSLSVRGVAMPLMLTALFLTVSQAWGQIAESFESGLPTSYTTTTSYTLSSGVWTGSASQVIRGTAGVTQGSYSLQLRSQTGAQITTPTLVGGVGVISFNVQGSTGSGGLQVRVSNDNGVNWTQVTGSPISFGTTNSSRSFTVNDATINRVQFYRTSAAVYIDEVDITSFSVSTPDPEPTNHATSLTCNAALASVDLSWTDATGAQLPAGYLIKWSDVSYADITNPTDGSTANGANSTTVAQGTEAATISGLTSGTAHYFKVWPYTNSGGDIDYKTNATIPQTSCTTLSPPVIVAAPGSLTGFTAVVGSPSTEQTFTVSGDNLTGNLSVGAVSGFEYSLDNSTYTSTLTIPVSGGNVTGEPRTVYVRLTGVSVGSFSGNATISGGGASSVNVSLNGSVTPVPISPCTELFISEYVEGSGSEKYIEIYNPTSAAVNLATGNYSLRLYANGASSTTSDVALSGTIPAYGTVVYRNSSASFYGAATVSTAVNFNGNDAIALAKGGTNIDIFGRIGNDPGSSWTVGGNTTIDKTLVRNADVQAGVDVNPTGTGPSAFVTLGSEWTQFDIDDVSNLGSHTCDCFVPNPEATISINTTTGSEDAETAITLTISTDVAVTGNQTVQVTLGGTGVTNGDFTGVTFPVTVTILDGQDEATVSFTVNDDSDVEGDETATFTIGSPSSGINIGTPSSVSLDIDDNDNLTSAESAVITQGGESAIIPSLTNGTITNNSDGVQVWHFRLYDGDGSGNDADDKPTRYSGFTIRPAAGNTVPNWDAAIADVKFFRDAGATPIFGGGVLTSAATITFSIPSAANHIDVADNGFVDIYMRLTLENNLPSGSDGQHFAFSIDDIDVNVNTDALTYSQLGTFTATSDAADNEIDILATLQFIDAPTTVSIGSNFSITVSAIDANGNVDVDVTSAITLAQTGGTGTLSGTTTANLVNGTFTFTALNHDTEETVQVTASGGSYSSVSVNVNVVDLPYQLFDDFNRADNNTVGIPSSGGSTAWTEQQLAGEVFRAAVSGNQLYLGGCPAGVSSGSTGGTGMEQARFNVENFYETLFDNAGGTLEWFFNMKQTRTDPSGFGANTYAVAVVLGCDENDFQSANADGYAVVIGNTSNPDPVRLVRFSGGLTSNTNVTNVAVTGQNDADAYYSVHVTFNPCDGEWSIAARDDGDTDFAAPNVGSLGAIVTGTDQTHTGLDLRFFGAAWQHSSGCGEFARFDNFNIPNAGAATTTAKVWNGSVNNNWNEPNNWGPCPGVPAQTNDVVIPNTIPQPVISGSPAGFCKDLTLEAGSQLTINSAQFLNVYGNLLNNGNPALGAGTISMEGAGSASVTGPVQVGNFHADKTTTLNSMVTVSVQARSEMNGNIVTNGNFMLLSGAELRHGTGTAAGGGTVTGNITMQRQGTATANVYNYWSTPVAGGVLPGNNGYLYDPTQGTLDNSDDATGNGDSGWLTHSGAMTTGRGYASTAGGLASFVGVPNDDAIPFAVTNAASNNRFNLVGNPYPSPISATTFLSVNGPSGTNRIAGALYFWSNDQPATSTVYDTDDYAVWSTIGSVSTGPGASGPVPNGSVGTCQGFMVEALSSGNIQFTNAMRGGTNTQFFKLEEETHMDRIWLNLHGQAKYNQILVAFRDDATEQRDPLYDAYKVRGNAHIALGAVQDDEEFVIVAFPSLTIDRVIPLLTHVSQSGAYTFEADSLDGFVGYNVYLEDLQTGQLHPLQQGSTVTVQMGPQDEYGRFQLRFSPELVTGIADVDAFGGRIICIGTELQVFLSDGMNVDGELRLVDALGRTVMHRGVSVTDGRSSLLDVSGFSTGVYFAEFRSGSVSARGRFILR